MKEGRGQRVNVYLPDPELWYRIKAAAIAASAREGRVISASEWLVDAAERKLAQEAHHD
jgi:hypothetical protein